MKKTIVFLLAAVLSAAAFASQNSGNTQVQQQSQAVSGALERAVSQEQKAQDLGLFTIQSTWERCEVLVSRPRGNGKRVRVVKPWTCRDVSTTCSAVVNEDKAFASAACYYVSHKDDQQVTLKNSYLISANGKRRSLLKNLALRVKEFVVFHLQ